MYLYRKAGLAVTLMVIFAAGGFSAQAQMRLLPPERTTPRAVAVVETDARHAQRMIPITLFYEHRYYDAGLYRAAPVPLALVPQTVYEVQQAGKPVGLFTVLNPVHVEGQWMARGKYQAASENSAHRKHDEPVARADSPNDPKRPVLYRREGSEGDDQLTATHEAGGSGADVLPQSADAVEDPERPLLRRGRGREKPAVESKISEVEDSYLWEGARREVAISDAGKALPLPDLFFHCSQEERESVHRQAQKLALAELQQVAASRAIPMESLRAPAEEDLRVFNLEHGELEPGQLENGEYATVVYSARFAPANALSEQPSPGWVATVIARYDGRVMTVVYAAVSDPRELELYPELRPVDLVDAEGQGRYLLLLRERLAGGIRWRLGRITPYEMQTVFVTAER